MRTRLFVCLFYGFLYFVNHGLVARSSVEELSGSGGMGEFIFDITWPGKFTDSPHKKIIPGDTQQQQQSESVPTSSNDLQSLEEADPSNKLLPDGLLPEYYESSPVVFTTRDKEKYKCILPDAIGVEEKRKKIQDGGIDDDDDDVSPENLLSMLSGKCTRLLMGYWTYELCHGDYVRQFHEEKQTPEQSKLDEYYLGKEDKKSKVSKSSLTSTSTSSSSKDKIPVWHYGGKDYPYYMVEMGGGTPCELANGQPRSIKIKFICDMESHQTGSFLHIEEIQTCKYEAVVSTTQLCQNQAYRLKESPIHTIQCYAEEDSPRRPTILLEHELTSAKFQPLGGTMKKTQGSMKGGSEQGSLGESYRDLDQFRKGLQSDEQFAKNFLDGETCLSGGSSGWWQHEICYGKYVRQIHKGPAGTSQVVYLGFWDEESHKKWFRKTGRRKRSKVHVIHLYSDGDVCDMTQQRRQCQVKLKCGKHHSSTHISLFLEEPTTCNYILTVESGFLCPYIKDTNEDGLISLEASTTKTQNTKESNEKDSSSFSQADRTTSRQPTQSKDEVKRPGSNTDSSSDSDNDKEESESNIEKEKRDMI